MQELSELLVGRKFKAKVGQHSRLHMVRSGQQSDPSSLWRQCPAQVGLDCLPIACDGSR